MQYNTIQSSFIKTADKTQREYIEIDIKTMNKTKLN